MNDEPKTCREGLMPVRCDGCGEWYCVEVGKDTGFCPACEAHLTELEELDRRRRILDGEDGELGAGALSGADDLTLDDIVAMGDALMGAAMREIHTVHALAQYEERLALWQARALQDAYAAGEISGKNAEERARAERVYLSASDDCRKLAEIVARYRQNADRLKAERQVKENVFATLRAWLYSRRPLAS